MLHYIRGDITMKFDGGVVVETGGLGYEVYVPDNSPLYLREGKGPVLVYTAMLVREDDVSLYGFADKDSLVLFQKLRTVNGVGAKAAMAVLSAMPVSEVKKAILFEDAAMLTRANGIGKKTAQRIVLELKDKLDGVISSVESGEGAVAMAALHEGRAEALEAMMGLGYSRAEASSALAAIQGDDLKTEEYLKRALRSLGGR